MLIPPSSTSAPSTPCPKTTWTRLLKHAPSGGTFDTQSKLPPVPPCCYSSRKVLLYSEFTIRSYGGLLFAEGVSEYLLRCRPQESHLGVLARQAQATELGVAGFEEGEEVGCHNRVVLSIGNNLSHHFKDVTLQIP